AAPSNRRPFELAFQSGGSQDTVAEAASAVDLRQLPAIKMQPLALDVARCRPGLRLVQACHRAAKENTARELTADLRIRSKPAPGLRRRHSVNAQPDRQVTARSQLHARLAPDCAARRRTDRRARRINQATSDIRQLQDAVAIFDAGLDLLHLDAGDLEPWQ